jgi:hypothetical protein
LLGAEDTIDFLALAIGFSLPIIRILSGRVILSSRVMFISVCFDLFLACLIGALLAPRRQVVFYTGGNDAFDTYMSLVNSDLSEKLAYQYWELVKISQRLHDRLFPSSHNAPDALLLESLQKENPLRLGILAADEYCGQNGLLCEFVLQPLLATRKIASGKEQEMKKSLLRELPGLDEAVATMFTDAMALNPQHQVYVKTDEHYFVDAIHVNEAANQRIAQYLATTIGFGRK